MAKDTSDRDVVNLSFPRGDNKTVRLTVTDSLGAAVDLSGLTLLLSVHSVDEPVDAATEIFVLTGNVTDGPNGVVEFKPTTTQAVQAPEVYFYDIQLTLVDGTRLSIVTGTWTYVVDFAEAGVSP